MASANKLGAMRAAEAKSLKVYMRLVLDDSPTLQSRPKLSGKG